MAAVVLLILIHNFIFFYCILICFSCLILDGFYQYFIIIIYGKILPEDIVFLAKKKFYSYLQIMANFFGIYILIFN